MDGKKKAFGNSEVLGTENQPLERWGGSTLNFAEEKQALKNAEATDGKGGRISRINIRGKNADFLRTAK